MEFLLFSSSIIYTSHCEAWTDLSDAMGAFATQNEAKNENRCVTSLVPYSEKEKRKRETIEWEDQDCLRCRPVMQRLNLTPIILGKLQ